MKKLSLVLFDALFKKKIPEIIYEAMSVKMIWLRKTLS